MNAAAERTTDKPVWPSPLRPGDVIGLFSPAGPVRDRNKVETGIHLLREMGFRPLVLEPLQEGDGFLAGPDRERANEFHALWAREEVKALLAVRGGYGCLRLLPHLDLAFFSRHPKLLIGFSDITALLNPISRQTGLVTVHGPVLTSLERCDQASLQMFFTLLTGRPERYRPRDLEILRPGTARGNLVGGNLTTLVHLLATPWEIPWDNAILVLEDTGEPAYRLDRMLTQLAIGGMLERVNGLILGGFDPGHEDSLETIRLQEQVWERVLELTARTRCPVWGNFPVGHQRKNLALPLGVPATMDSATGSLLIDS